MHDSLSTHWIITRFSVQTDHASTIHLDPRWLRHRLWLLTQFTLPSVATQFRLSHGRLRWVLLVDMATPMWVSSKIQSAAPWAELASIDGLWSPEALRRSLRSLGWKGEPTTRLDSDDVLLPGYLSSIYRSIERQGTGVHTVPIGYQLAGNRLYWRCYVQNPFLTYYEPEVQGRTVFDIPHWNLVKEKVHIAGLRPGWIQHIHGGNIANSVRGVRVRGGAASTQLLRAGVRPPDPTARRAGWFQEACRTALATAARAIVATPRLLRLGTVRRSAS
jgi:hypothetical protein